MVQDKSVKRKMVEAAGLRPATAADAERLAHLWVVTFPDKFGPILGRSAERVICDWLRLSQRHLQTTTLIEVDRMVAGYIVLETPSSPRQDNGRWLWRALQLHNGIFGALRGFVLMALIDHHRHAKDDEVYIEMLGVAPNWRGQGLARKLITHAQDVARAEGANALTLDVVSDNTVAIGLYEQMGFVITMERQSRVLYWITGHQRYLEMVKHLD